MSVALADVICHHRMVASVGERIRQAREKRGLGVNDVDRMLDHKSNGYTSRIERAPEGPGARNLRKLADALGVRVEWLATGQGPMEDPAEGECRYPNRATAVEQAGERSLGAEEFLLWCARGACFRELGRAFGAEPTCMALRFAETTDTPVHVRAETHEHRRGGKAASWRRAEVEEDREAWVGTHDFS